MTERKEIILEEKNQDLGRKSSGECERVEGKKFGREKRDFLSREIKEKRERNRVEAIYRNTNLDGSRSCRALILDKYICWGAVEHLSMTKKPQWIEQLSSRQKLSWWIENLSRSYWDKFQKASMDWKCNKICQEKQSKGLDR